MTIYNSFRYMQGLQYDIKIAVIYFCENVMYTINIPILSENTFQLDMCSSCLFSLWQIPQVRWLNTTQIIYLTVLEVQSLKSFLTVFKPKCWQGFDSYGGSRGESIFQLLEATYNSWLVAPSSIFKADHFYFCFSPFIIFLLSPMLMLHLTWISVIRLSSLDNQG